MTICGMAICGSQVDLSVGECCNIWNLCILEGSSCLTTGGPLSILLVSGNVEGDEEQEVGADNAHTSESCKFLPGTFASVWHPIKISRGEIGVRCKIDEDWETNILAKSKYTQGRGLTKINNELNDLQAGDPFLPPDANSSGTLEVVPVHHDVNHEIEGDDNP